MRLVRIALECIVEIQVGVCQIVHYFQPIERKSELSLNKFPKDLEISECTDLT